MAVRMDAMWGVVFSKGGQEGTSLFEISSESIERVTEVEHTCQATLIAAS